MPGLSRNIHEPSNLATINRELLCGQRLSCSRVTDMSVLVSSDTFYRFQKAALFSVMYRAWVQAACLVRKASCWSLLAG